MHNADYMLSQDVSPRGYSVETAKHIIKLFSPSGYSHTILAFLYQTVWQYSEDMDLPIWGVECKRYEKNRDFRPVSRYVSKIIQDRAIVTMKCE